SFSFLVEGGFVRDNPKWSFLNLYNTSGCSISVPLYSSGTYYTLSNCSGSTLTSTTVPSLANVSSAIVDTTNNKLKLTVITDDAVSTGQGRTYNFLFSSYG